MRVVVMGVTGCGKSSVGAALAAALGYEFADADDFHPPENVDAMSRGIPLTDDDRWPWLDAVGAWMAPRADGVVACSALRRAHRDRLREAGGPMIFLHLAAPQRVIEERVRQRTELEDHFAGVELVATQYAVLEPLGFDEAGGSIDVSRLSIAQVVAEAAEIAALQDD
ncbi:gluconokinase, GntK/IdnK-type [Demequina sp.]|uniref:gluconokinase n=1 Tax=Demequina sp. TaxID=2050685 RepID=UPI0025BADCEA|nr:gluconokinase, GntK/IdnK-type [Demequina sp.]